MKHTFIYNKANRTKNESGITRSRTHLFNIIKPYSVVKRMAVIIMTAIMIICDCTGQFNYTSEEKGQCNRHSQEQ